MEGLMKLLHAIQHSWPSFGSRRLSAGVVAEWRKQYSQVELFPTPAAVRFRI